MQAIFNGTCKSSNRKSNNMETGKKYLGVILLLLGVLCLVLYKFALPENALLITGMALELVGILAYIFINKRNA